MENTKSIDAKSAMTSELVALELIDNSGAYKEEFYRRLRYCGLEDKTIDSTYEFEKAIILNEKTNTFKNNNKMVKMRWFNLQQKLFNQERDFYKNFFTMSEVVAITDEAEYLVVNRHEDDTISGEVFSEIYQLSESGRQEWLMYQLLDRLKGLEWKMENIHKFFQNEFEMLKKYKWNRNCIPFGIE